MSSVRVTLAAGIALTLIVGAIVLTRSPPQVLLNTNVQTKYGLAITQGEVTICQGDETLPAGVTAIRFWSVAFLGSNVELAVYRGPQMLTQGHHDPAWAGQTVTVPVSPLSYATSGVRVCAAFAPNSQLIQFFGTPTGERNTARFLNGDQITPEAPPSGGSLRGRLRIEYLGPGHRSWWSRALTVATNMGFGHFIGGKSVALLTILLVAAMAIFTVRLTLREQP